MRDYPVPCQLPAQPASGKLLGRAEERIALHRRLALGEQQTAVVGAAGMGKTALAAAAIRDLVGSRGERLSGSPFPDGIVLLDLYQLKANAELIFTALANALIGTSHADRPALDRAREASRNRRILLIFEGAEEADGKEGRVDIGRVLAALDPLNARLILTRDSTQAAPSATIRVGDALGEPEADALFAALTSHAGLQIPDDVRSRVLRLLQGHPLALTWAAGLLARGDEDAGVLADEWQRQGLPSLTDPDPAGSHHTLHWLYERSVRGLDAEERMVLDAAGCIANAPIPVGLIEVLPFDEASTPARQRLRRLVQAGLMRFAADRAHWQFTHALAYQFARNAPTGTRDNLSRHLASWVHAQLLAALAASGDSVHEPAGRLLLHAAALAEPDRDARLWEPLMHGLSYEIVDAFLRAGRLDLASRVAATVQAWMQQLHRPVALLPRWQRERANSLDNVAKVLRERGGLTEAVAYFRESLAIAERLARADDTNKHLQRDLFVSMNNVANIRREQGNLEDALTLFNEACGIVRKLAHESPLDIDVQRDLCASLDNLANIQRDRGNLVMALIYFSESLAMARRLCDADPQNQERQHGLAMSLLNEARVRCEQGDLDTALSQSSHALAIARELSAADASNLHWQRDYSIVLDNVANVLRKRREPTTALKYCERSLHVRRRLVEADASNALWKRDLSVALDNVATLYRETGRLDAALDHYSQSIAMRRELVQADSSNAHWRRDLAISIDNVARVQRDRKQFEVAKKLFAESIAIRVALTAADPSNAQWQRDLAAGLDGVARVCRHQKEFGEARAHLRESLAIRQVLVRAAPSNQRFAKELVLTLEDLVESLVESGDRHAIEQYKQEIRRLRLKYPSAPLPSASVPQPNEEEINEMSASLNNAVFVLQRVRRHS